MSSWLDKELKALAVSVDEWKEGVSILSRLYKWYHDTYLQGPEQVIVNVPVNISLGVGVAFQDVIDIITLDEGVTVADVGWTDNRREPTGRGLYRDPVTHIRAWAFHAAFGNSPEKYSRCYIGPDSVTTISYHILEGEITRTENAVLHAARGMVAGIYYPSVSAHCDMCTARTQCKF